MRQERIVEYLRELDARLATLEREKINGILADVEKVDLVESADTLRPGRHRRNGFRE